MLLEATDLGPTFSNQVWSTIWLAMVWPSTRFSFGVSRWITAGKNPSILEKWCGVVMGRGLNCLLVSEASSRAVIRPRIVTASAASLSSGGIDITGVFSGRMLEVISNPATILPQARRLIGLMTAELFSLMGDRELKRGWPMDTKNTTRRLYTAVKEVARRVKVRAQALRWEVFRASMMASLEKKPARKGVPVRARLPRVRQEDVNGVR